jgi:hypothetical protein
LASGPDGFGCWANAPRESTIGRKKASLFIAGLLR